MKVAEATGKVLYVDIDTINQNIHISKNQKAIIEKQRCTSWKQAKTKAQALQADYIEYQKKAQAGELTQQQTMALEKDWQTNSNIAQQEQQLSEQLMFKTQRFRKN